MAAPPTSIRIDPALAPPEFRELTEQISKQAGQVGNGLSRALTFGDNFLCDIIGPLAVRGAPAWIRPTLLNSWVDSSGTLVAQYRKLITGEVVLDGEVKSGTPPNIIATLPSDYAPPQDVQLSTVSNNLFGKLVIGNSGNLIPAVGSGTSFSIAAKFMAANSYPGPTLARDVLFKPTVVTKRPMAVWICSAQLKNDLSSYASVRQPAWSYQNDGQIRVTSIPGLVADTDYLITFLVVGG